MLKIIFFNTLDALNFIICMFSDPVEIHAIKENANPLMSRFHKKSSKWITVDGLFNLIHISRSIWARFPFDRDWTK